MPALGAVPGLKIASPDKTGGYMRYECVFSPRDAGWVVEAINFDRDGEVYRTLFTGPEAEQRAREYAEWKQAASSLQDQRQRRRSVA